MAATSSQSLSSRGLSSTEILRPMAEQVVRLRNRPQGPADAEGNAVRMDNPHIGHSDARPRKAKKPTTSVTVVTNTVEDTAGSKCRRFRGDEDALADRDKTRPRDLGGALASVLRAKPVLLRSC